MTVLQYYTACAWGTKTKNTKNFPKNCYYLYITADPHVFQKKSKYSADPVSLVNLEEDLEKFGTSWRFFKEYITSKK